MEIDVRKHAREISPMLFGHNLEHTRSCVWRGLAAQLVRNRKFAGPPARDGVARHWYRIGPPSSWHLVEHAPGRKDTLGEPYTARFRPAGANGYRQRVQGFGRGAPCGTGQRGVFLVEGKEYEGRAALLSDRELSVRVRVFGADAADAYFETAVKVGPDGWTEHPFEFTSPAADDDARIEITFDGTGVLYVGAVSLLPADHFLGMRSDVIELLKEISVPILRWPGGNFAGSYRWMDGLMPRDRRPPLWGAGILPHTDGYDEHEIGTDEFLALCGELGSEPCITINMSFEGPEEAGAWVMYCNGSAETKWGRLRAERGHPEPYAVKYWSLGNEMGYGHMAGPNAPEDFAKAAAACAAAMKEADSSIVLISSGTWWKDEWYERVLAEIGDCFDHIAYHEYTLLVKDYEGEEGAKEFGRVATAPDETLRTLKGVRARLDAHAPGEKSVGISFDEWNVWYAWFRAPGVVEGIHAASMLNMFCREAGGLGMTFGAYFEPVNEGAILVEPGSARLTPAGKVFSLFRPHQGNVLVELEAQPADADLDVAASVDEAEKKVTVTLVNRSPDGESDAEFTLKNAGEIVSAEGTLLTSPDFLPGSTFTQKELDVAVRKDGAFAVSVPKHSVARVQVSYA